MADGGDGGAEAAPDAASAGPVPGPRPSSGLRGRLRTWLTGPGLSLWLVAGLGLLYALRGPLRLCENMAAGERLHFRCRA